MLEPLVLSGVGTLGWSELHLNPQKENLPHKCLNPPENMGGMVGGMKPRPGGGAISSCG